MSKFSVTFSVRYYECDGYGHVNHANYLRYLIEVGLMASATIGYSQATLEETDGVWFAREHDIEYIRPLSYGDTLTIQTWLVSYHEMRCLRRYEFWRDDQLVARAISDWVYVGYTSQKPKPIPPEMLQKIITHNAILEPDLKREPFPLPAPPPPELFTAVYPVEWRDIDPQMHVNAAAYLSYIENCNTDVCAHFNWPLERMTVEGFGIIARRYRIQYLRAALLKDQLKISTWVSNRKRATAIRHHKIQRAADDALLVRTHALWVWINLETGQPIRIPQPFLNDFAPNFSE